MRIYRGSFIQPIYKGNAFVGVSYVGQAKVPPGSEFQVLNQGAGFGSPTAQPADVGAWSNASFDGKPMAHWDTVQWSEVPDTGDFCVGVTAFHKHGIDRVEFSLDNGPWVSVSGNLQTNPTTGVDGFVVQVPTSGLDFNLAGSSSADRSVEVRAIVYPNTAGAPRVLEPLILSESISDRVVYVNSETGNNSTGTGSAIAPYLTIHHAIKQYAAANSTDCRGLKVRLQSVSNVVAYPYELDTYFQGTVVTGNSWITIESDEGLSNSDVQIRHPIGLNAAASKFARIAQSAHIRFKDLTIKETRLYTSLGSAQWIWCDGCHWAGSYGDDREFLEGIGVIDKSNPFVPGDQYTWSRTSFRTIGGERRAFVTECTQTGGFHFAKDAQLCRNCTSTGIVEDASEGHKFCVNYTTSEAYDDIDACTTDYHADMVTIAEHTDLYDPSQWNDLENVIVFNYNAQRFDGQCIFLARSNSLYNMAFVNVLWTRPDNNSDWSTLVGAGVCVGDGSTCKPWGNDSNGVQMIGVVNGIDHVVFQNCLFSDIVNNRQGMDFMYGGGTTTTAAATNIVFDQCVVWEFYNDSGVSSDVSDWSGSNNHVMRFSSSAQGQSIRGSKFFELSSTTYGDPVFKNTSGQLVYADFTTNGTAETNGWAYGTEEDFRPGTGSPLLVGVANRGVVRDITGRTWTNQQPIGPLAP